eukprot:6820517-Pyramimonas_sp.AAC.1
MVAQLGGTAGVGPRAHTHTHAHTPRQPPRPQVRPLAILQKCASRHLARPYRPSHRTLHLQHPAGASRHS